MRCPVCNSFLEAITSSYGVSIDRCPRCEGLWFDEGEFNQMKDEKDDWLRWVDIDLWDNEKKFQIRKGRRTCPKDGVPLYRVGYNESAVDVDVCNICRGMWLDAGEFGELLQYLRAKIGKESLAEYVKDTAKEAVEIFTGPEDLRSEMSDFLVVQKLLFYRLFIRFPFLADLIGQLP